MVCLGMIVIVQKLVVTGIIAGKIVGLEITKVKTIQNLIAIQNVLHMNIQLMMQRKIIQIWMNVQMVGNGGGVMMAILQLGLLPLSFFVGALAKSDAFMEVCLKAVEYAPSLLLGPALFSELFANDIAKAAVTDTLLKALGESDAFLAVFSTYVATYAVLPIAATVYVYLAREPSGEKMGRPSKGPSFERYSYHFLMGTAAFILGYFCYFLVYLSILLFVVYCVVYYAVASLYARTFKVSLWDLYGYAFSLVAMASGIVLAAIAAV